MLGCLGKIIIFASLHTAASVHHHPGLVVSLQFEIMHLVVGVLIGMLQGLQSYQCYGPIVLIWIHPGGALPMVGPVSGYISVTAGGEGDTESGLGPISRAVFGCLSESCQSPPKP